MTPEFIERIDAGGRARPLPPGGVEAALRQGEPLHRVFRPNIAGDYADHLNRMADEGAGLIQLVDDDDVRALAVWRTYLTTYCGRRFEVDDLVTAEGWRSRGYGATLIAALEAKARALGCDQLMLTSATWRAEAHRFYFRQRFTIRSFLFAKPLDPENDGGLHLGGHRDAGETAIESVDRGPGPDR